MTHKDEEGEPIKHQTTSRTSSSSTRDALLYRGTGNNASFMRPIKRILKNNGFKVQDVWWSKKKYSVAYTNPLRWNIKRGSFDLVIGHSAGGFPTALTKLNTGGKRVGINPFLTQYAFMDRVFHAIDDWLVPPDLDKVKNVEMYSGTHSTVPLDAIDLYVKKFF